MKFVLNRVYLTLFVLLLAQCQRERDKYYEDPGWSGKPAYEVLQDKGRFGLYLQCVDKTMYATLLKGNGLWTVFAPNDEAFGSYLRGKGYSSVAEMPQSEAEKIVAYSMLYNKYPFDRLTDVLSGGWDTLKSVKKKTPYYEALHREYYRNDSIWVLNPLMPTSATIGSGTYKYLPFYLSRYFTQVPLTAKDYETFYPTSTYTGRNVQAASVLEQDWQAANGVVHEVDRVNEPLPTLEDILQEENYSRFKALIDLKSSSGDPYFYSYLTSAGLTEYFRTAYPSWNINQVYAKFYGLDVPLNCERFWEPAEEESNGYTLFAPNNRAMEDFRKKIETGYGYASLDQLPQNVIGHFINAQMVRSSMIWPSQYKGAKNESENYINGEGERGRDLSAEDYPDIRPASNGFFYGSNTYVKSHYFETVLTEVLLRPSKYLFVYNALQKYFMASLWEDFIKCPLNGYTEENYTVLLPSDEQLREDGFTWEWVSPAYGFRHAHEASGTTFADTRMQRLIRSHVFKRIKPSPDDNSYVLDFQSGTLPEYGGYGYAVNDYGDMVRYRDGKVQMLGNYGNGEWVEVRRVETDFTNGQVYTADKLLQYSKECVSSAGCEEQDMVDYLKAIKVQNSNVSKALDYLIFFAENTKNQYILSKESFWTILLPNNAAIDAANVRENGVFPYLPLLSGLQNGYNQATLPDSWMDDMDQAINFFKYHLIPGMLFVDDGYPNVLFSSGQQQADAVVATTLKTEINLLQASTFVKIEKDNSSSNALSFSTAVVSEPLSENRTVRVVRGENKSNLFGAKAVIHEVDGFLAYKPIKEAAAGN